MRWLRDRIHGRRRNQRPEQPAAEQPSPEPPQPAAPNFERPRLVLLVRDAAGPASYQLHSFEDETEAASFVQFWFPGDVANGVIAFWASHREPEVETGERPAEVVVLVRDETSSKSVCPFSFPGIDLAQSWVARESDRGLHLHPDHVLIYWAVPARISRDHWGRMHVWPSEPPALRPQGRRATLTAPAFQQKPAPAPPTETGAATPTKPVFEPNLQSRRSLARAPENEEAPFAERRLPADDLLAALEVEETAQDPPTEALAPADEAEQEPFTQELPPVEAAAGPFFGPPMEATAPADEAEQGPSTEEPPLVEAAAAPFFESPMEAIAAADEADQEPHADEPAEVETVAELLAGTTDEAPAVEPAEVETAPELFPETPPVDEVPERPAPPRTAKPRKGNKPFDAGEEIEELLRRSGWEKREGPFRGFGSPPGKF